MGLLGAPMRGEAGHRLERPDATPRGRRAHLAGAGDDVRSAWVGLTILASTTLTASCAEAPTPPPPPPIEAVVLAGAGDIAVCDRVGDEATATLLDSIGGYVFAAGDNLH